MWWNQDSILSSEYWLAVFPFRSTAVCLSKWNTSVWDNVLEDEISPCSLSGWHGWCAVNIQTLNMCKCSSHQGGHNTVITGYLSMCVQIRWTSFEEDSLVLTNTWTIGIFSFLWQSSSEPGPAGRAELCLPLGYVRKGMDSPMNELIFNYMAECNIVRL